MNTFKLCESEVSPVSVDRFQEAASFRSACSVAVTSLGGRACCKVANRLSTDPAAIKGCTYAAPPVAKLPTMIVACSLASSCCVHAWGCPVDAPFCSPDTEVEIMATSDSSTPFFTAISFLWSCPTKLFLSCFKLSICCWGESAFASAWMAAKDMVCIMSADVRTMSCFVFERLERRTGWECCGCRVVDS